MPVLHYTIFKSSDCFKSATDLRGFNHLNNVRLAYKKFGIGGELMSKYRCEIKMNINPFDKAILSSRLSKVMKKDEHTGPRRYYKVRSIYFDDLDNTALKEKLYGVINREKFRMRIYDNTTDVIRLEKKVKHNNLGYKESALLTLQECQSILKGDYGFLKERPEMVCKQLYTKMRTGLYKAKTIVEYDREAYVWEPGNIRITLDSNLKTGITSTDFLNIDVPLVNASDNAIILEIKYDNYLPAHISDVIHLQDRQISSNSKYVFCRRFG